MPKQSFKVLSNPKNPKKAKSVYALIDMTDNTEITVGGEVYIQRDKPGICVFLVKPDMPDKDGNLYGSMNAEQENKKRKAYASMLMAKIKREPTKDHYTTRPYIFFDSFKDIPTEPTNIVVNHQCDVSSMSASDKVKEIRELQLRLNELKRSCESYNIDAMEMLDTDDDGWEASNSIGAEACAITKLNSLILNATSGGDNDTFTDEIWLCYNGYKHGKCDFDMTFKRVSAVLKKIDEVVSEFPETIHIVNLEAYLKYVAKKFYEDHISHEYQGRDAPVEYYPPPDALYTMIDAYGWK